jgi:hypothetical protein
LADSAFGRGRLSSTGYLARKTKMMLSHHFTYFNLAAFASLICFEFDGIDPDTSVGIGPSPPRVTLQEKQK